MSLFRYLLRAALLIALMLGAAFAANAQTATQFYKGRTLTVIVPAGPSGGYPLYGQLLSQYIGKHIPGNPTVVVQYMPGAGGNVAANYLYNVAAKNGTVIALVFSTLTVTQALQPSGVQFDATKFSWLGSIAPMINVVSVWYKAPAVTLEGLKEKQVVIGATGKLNDLYIYPQLMNALLGTKFKIVLGYDDSGSVLLAMENGEAQGIAMGIEVWQATRPEWIKDKKVIMIAQNGLKRDKLIPDVPTLVELAKSPEDKEIMTFVAAPAVLGRAVTAPPGISRDRLAVLRKAFNETMQDPDFVKAVTSRGLSVQPTSGQDVANFIQKIGATPKPVIERTKQLLGY